MSVKGLTYFEQHFYFSNVLVKFFLRISPDQSSYSVLCIFCGLCIYLIPCILHQIYVSYMNVDSSIKVIQSMLPVWYFLIVYYKLYVSLHTVKLLLAHIKIDYESVTDNEEIQIMEKYTNQSKYYSYIIVVFVFILGGVLISPSILSIILYMFGTTDDGHLILPLPVNNVVHQGFLFYSWFIYQIIMIFLVITLILVFSPFSWVMIQHICGQFQILRLHIHEPFVNNQKHIQKVWLNRTYIDEKNWMIGIIKFYTRITKYVEIYKNVTKTNYLIIVFMTMVNLLLDFLRILNISSIIDNLRIVIECVIHLVTSLFVTYITFYTGQMLINHSDDTVKELCNIPFYDLSIKTQKLLLFALTRSMKHCELSIGGIFIANLEIFSDLVQKTFSFAMVFYSLL